MAIGAEALLESYYKPSKDLPKSGFIVEFPRVLSLEELEEIKAENTQFIFELSIEHDTETVETAQFDMKKNPAKRLKDLYFNTPKTDGQMSISVEPEKDYFGKPIFRHPETRYIP